MGLERVVKRRFNHFSGANEFVRRVVCGFAAAVSLAGLLIAPLGAASVIPIIVDDVQIFIPCADIAGNVGTAGASIALAERTAQSDSAGNYTFTCVLPGTYTLLVSKSNHTFSPESMSVSVPDGAPETIVRNFSVASVCADVVGNAGAPGATIAAGTQLAVTDANGNFRIACLPSGSIAQLSAAKPGYIFSPSAAFVSIPAGLSDSVTQNFGAQTCGSIVGNVGVGGVKIRTDGRYVVSTTSGVFNLTCLAAGTYTVQPDSNDYLFTPATATIVVPANASVTITQNFVARPVAPP